MDFERSSEANLQKQLLKFYDLDVKGIAEALHTATNGDPRILFNKYREIKGPYGKPDGTSRSIRRDNYPERLTINRSIKVEIITKKAFGRRSTSFSVDPASAKFSRYTSDVG
ncbi:unnamed protein product [Allacma fusca]|uniref:Uncharacterized protein n=1 Tax=Allacma fusca TaxID=39272 RepID=A0A8J2KP63_9HEXA|nr:unnamed protein product [Allacma fusca]